MSAYKWGWPLNSKKAHVFYDGRSLCMKWLFFGAADEIKAIPDSQGPDDCAVCYKKLRTVLIASSASALK